MPLFANERGQGSPSRPRLAFIINSLTAGGAERALVTLLASLSGRLTPFEVHLVLLDEEPQLHRVPGFVTVHVLDCRGSIATSVFRLRRLLRSLDPELALSFINRSNYANVVAAIGTDRGCVISQRNHTSRYFPRNAEGMVHRALVRWLYPRADAVIAVSDGVAEDLVACFGAPREKMSVIHNVTGREDIERAAEEPPGVDLPARYLVAIGALVPGKGFDLLVRALPLLPTAHDLVILGEGPERESLAALVAELGLSGRVRMPGHLRNPYPVLKGAEALVAASYSEGYPNVLVEALALGRPVVATDCPAGPAEILEGRASEGAPALGRYGVLSPMGDFRALAEAIGLALAEPNRARFSALGPGRATELGDRASEEYWRVIEAHLRMKRRSAEPAHALSSAEAPGGPAGT